MPIEKKRKKKGRPLKKATKKRPLKKATKKRPLKKKATKKAKKRPLKKKTAAARRRGKSGKLIRRAKNIPSIVNARLARLGVSRKQLAHREELSCDASTVFRFLSGDCDIKCANLEEVLDLLGMRIIASRGRPDWTDERIA